MRVKLNIQSLPVAFVGCVTVAYGQSLNHSIDVASTRAKLCHMAVVLVNTVAALPRPLSVCAHDPFLTGHWLDILTTQYPVLYAIPEVLTVIGYTVQCIVLRY